MKTPIIAAMILLSSCAAVPMNTSLSDLVLVNVKTNSADGVVLQFDSRLPLQHTVNVGTHDAESNINASYEKMLKEYMGAKFSKLGQGDVIISVTLDNLEAERKQGGDFHSVMMSMSSAGTEASVEAKIILSVTVSRSGKTLETKTIQSSATESFNTAHNKGLPLVFSEAINKASNKSLAMLNSYLASIEL